MLALGLVLIAHVGGIPTKADFTAPAELVDVADASYAVTWLDDDADLTGIFDFYYQPSNFPPGALVGSPEVVGVAIPNGQDVEITEPTDTIAWATTAVPAGSYYLYAITTDPPFDPIIGVSPAPVTVQHAGDPRWPALVVDEPDAVGDTQAEAFPVRFRASGEGPLTATIRGRNLTRENDQPYYDVASDVPLAEDSPGLFSGCHLWDLTALVEGQHYVEVTVRDPGGREHLAYSRTMNVSLAAPGPNPTCADVDPMADANPIVADAMTPDVSEPGGCGCRIGGATSDGTGAAGLAGLAGLALLAARARARRAQAPSPDAARRPPSTTSTLPVTNVASTA